MNVGWGAFPMGATSEKTIPQKANPRQTNYGSGTMSYGIAFCNQLLYNGDILAESALVHKLIISF